MNKKALLAGLMLIGVQLMNAQDDKIKFNAYSRALQQTNTLGAADTVNPDHTNKGNVLLDLGINVNPDKRTEIQAIVRFNNNFNGFYTAGAQATLRQLYVKGIVGRAFNYQVGDLYMQLTPYTFFNNNAEGSVNEGSIFRDLRNDYTNYENFSNRGNAWWQQGAHTNFSFAFDKSLFDTIRIDGFFLRNRASYAQFPSAFHAGGKITVTQSSKLKLAFNYLDLYEVGTNTIIDSLTTSNPVGSAEVEAALFANNKMKLKLMAEGGFSQYSFKGYNVDTKMGAFFDAGLQLKLKNANTIISANYSYVDPNFFSSAAQSKRVNYTNTPTTFSNYGNDVTNLISRGISIFDLVRDPALYNAGIVTTLMAYNPIYGNAQPYGKATPNRTGANINLQCSDSLQRIIADVDAAFLSEVVGEGSAQLRSFIVVKGGVDFHINKFLGWKKRLIVNTGYKFESTNRGGDTTTYVSLMNNMVDLGLEVETFKKLSLLAGYKMLLAQGNESMAVRNKFNDITTFNPINVDLKQSLIAVGLKYRFSEKTYLTLQDHIFNYTDNKTAANTYSINQVVVMFSMTY
ncbi:MAG: hypothetical protein ACKOXB_15220 [Flavobacteriales bacterium]